MRGGSDFRRYAGLSYGGGGHWKWSVHGASPLPAPALAPAPATGHTALLIIDMISGWDFPDADKLLPGALSIAGPIAALKARCTRAGVPTIYVDDNRGRWRSDFPKLVKMSLASGGAGAEITSALLPAETDYFVLKPKQSAFFAPPRSNCCSPT